jgi:putative ABC transport system permease protein
VSPAAAAELGLAAEEVGTLLVRAAAPVTADQVAALRSAAEADGRAWYVAAEERSLQRSTILRWLALLGSAAVALAVVAATGALASAEARHDRAILHAVGAAPSVRRAVAGGQTGALALVAGLLAVPAGLLPVGAIVLARDLPLVVPWSAIGTAVLVVPLLAAGGAAVLSRAELPAGVPRPT